MKSFAILAAVGAAVVAQELPSGECSQLCIGNMNKIANTEFNCAANDPACFCNRSNWAYGLRDCSQEACDAEQAAAAIAYGAARCADVEQTASGVLPAVPIFTGALGAYTGSIASEISMFTGSVQSQASSAVDDIRSIVSDIRSDLSEATDSAGSAIASATGAAGSAVNSITSDVASNFASATDAAGDIISSVVSSVESAASDAVSAAESAASDATGNDTGAAPIQTAVPALAGAGMLAMFFL